MPSSDMPLAHALYRAFILLLYCLVTNVEGRVVIDSAQPLYVEYGANLTLMCTSDKGRKLGWTEKIQDTRWQTKQINPVLGGRYITRYTLEKPTNHVSSTLIKMNMTLKDRGTYECQDEEKENSFHLDVTVVFIATEDVTLDDEKEAVYLYCSLRGFDTNLPYVDYHWYYKEQTILTNHKYDIVYREGTLQLTVNNPVYEDGGEYTCSFILQTNKGMVAYSRNATLNTDKLFTSGTDGCRSFLFSGWPVTMAAVFVILSYLCCAEASWS